MVRGDVHTVVCVLAIAVRSSLWLSFGLTLVRAVVGILAITTSRRRVFAWMASMT